MYLNVLVVHAMIHMIWNGHMAWLMCKKCFFLSWAAFIMISQLKSFWKESKHTLYYSQWCCTCKLGKLNWCQVRKSILHNTFHMFWHDHKHTSNLMSFCKAVLSQLFLLGCRVTILTLETNLIKGAVLDKIWSFSTFLKSGNIAVPHTEIWLQNWSWLHVYWTHRNVWCIILMRL